MASKCDMCGKLSKKYSTIRGTIVCNKTCLNAYMLEGYLLRMEERREKEESLNQLAFEQAREMSAWLSVWRYGNSEQRKRAAKIINSF